MPKSTKKSSDSFVEDSFVEDSFAETPKLQNIARPIPAHESTIQPESQVMQTMRAPAREFVKSYRSHPDNLPANVVAGGGAILDQAFSFPVAGLDLAAQHGTPDQKAAAILAKILGGKAFETFGGAVRGGLEGVAGLSDKVFGQPSEGQLQTREEIYKAAPKLLALRAGEVAKGAKIAIPRAIKAVIPERVPIKLVAKAGKFKGPPDVVTTKANIALKEGINPANTRGLDKLNKAVDQLDTDVNSFMKSTDMVKMDNAARHIESLIEKVNSKELTPAETVGKIRAQVEQLYLERGEAIPADLAQKLKRGIYEKEKSAYQQELLTGKKPSYEVQTEMRIARGILGELKKLYPEIEPLLKKEGNLLSIRKDIRVNVRNQMVKSIIPNPLLLALHPKWWLVKTLSANKSLEYNLGRLLYRARGGSRDFKSRVYKEPPPYKRPPETVAKQAGVEFKGIQEGVGGNNLVIFNDPITGSTLALREGEFTPASIAKKLAESRKLHGK